MIKTQLIKWGFKLLCAIGLTTVLCVNIANAQDATDDNFKDKTKKGFVVIKFTSKWQEKKLDPKVFDGIKGYNDCIILIVKSEDAKKVVKKLRIRNYPSVALFHNGKKKEVWKADMDGVVDVTNKHLKKAISDALAGDVF